MRDVAMLYSAPMVRALLEGRKTKTRRLIKWQGPKGFPHSFAHAIVDNPAGVQRLLVPYNHPDDADLPWGESGYHRHYGSADPGDRIWVKETWSHSGDGVFEISQARMAAGNGRVIYRADGADEFPHAKYWPSIFMPKEFSRLTLHVTAVRVERLLSVTEEEAIAEGVEMVEPHLGAVGGWTFYTTPPEPNSAWSTARDSYLDLMESLHGKAIKTINPWVTVTTFEVERCNIVQARAA
jgi:hypothetical protein